MRTMVQTSFAEAGSTSRWARAANERWGSGGSRLRVGRRASRCARAHVPVVVAGPGRRRGVCRPDLGRVRSSGRQGGGGERATDGGAEAAAAAGIFDLSLLLDAKWDVPWGGKVLATGFLSWSFVFLGIGIFLAPALANSLHLDLTGTGSPDDKAYFLLLDQTCELAAGLGLIWLVTRPYAPLPRDLFRFSLDRPFDRRDGWLLWGLIGIAGGVVGVGVTAYLLSLIQQDGGAQSAGTADAVVTMLSKDPKVFLSILTVTSLMAPLLEEVIFRGFLLTTLTKWMPAPAAAFVSAGLFGAAHLTTRDFAQLTALGVVLGLSYVRTKNLATPMLIHSFWNSGVLFALEVLYLGGYDVTEIIKNQ